MNLKRDLLVKCLTFLVCVSIPDISVADDINNNIYHITNNQTPVIRDVTASWKNSVEGDFYLKFENGNNNIYHISNNQFPVLKDVTASWKNSIADGFYLKFE